MEINTKYEPLKKNRYYIDFKGLFKDIKPFTLINTERPCYENGKWKDITISFNDIIGSDVSTTRALMEGVHHYNNVRANTMKIDYDLNLLDPIGDTVQRWNISGIIREIDFGELDYSNDEICKIKMVVEPIKVILEF
jgi:hypothetical protein